MIDIEKEIRKKFPTLDRRSPLIKKSLFKVAKKLIHEDKINEFLQSADHLEGFDSLFIKIDNFKSKQNKANIQKVYVCRMRWFNDEIF